jgi:hypothetical protein
VIVGHCSDRSTAHGLSSIGPRRSSRRADTQLTFCEHAEKLSNGDIYRRTRQASALQFDECDAVVVVVSEDGLLTVYARGDPMARLQLLYQEARPNHRDLDEGRSTGSALRAVAQGGST